MLFSGSGTDMVIRSLRLKNYRNYDLLDMSFDPKTNILYGDNAQGKTNILEALYLSGTTKSHRGTKDRDMIQFGIERIKPIAINRLVPMPRIVYRIIKPS